jgi:hypothetical protein
MKLPNWFKIVWWVLLLILTGVILYTRLEAITSGLSVPADVFIFLIFVALMLVPIFSEIEFFGIKFKRELDELKRDITVKIGDIKNEIRNNQSQTVNATFQGYGPPPPDNKLPELEKEIDRIVKSKLKEHGIDVGEAIKETLEVPNDNLQLFKVRFSIEKRLRTIWEGRFENQQFDSRYRHQPIIKIIQDLSKFEIIDNNFQGVLREILSICNYAIHGEEVTENQFKFVMKNSKQVLEYLNQIN